MAQKERKTFQARIERLGGKGDLEGAIAASLEHLEKEPEDWSALLGLGALYFRGGRDEEAIACYTRVADHYQTVVPDAPSRPAAARSTRRTPARGRTSGRAGGKPAKPLQTIFNELRARARDTDDATIAHERFDLAQYHLRDGNEDAAMTELREAVKAPVLRFTAAAQLGRLLAGRNELEQAIEWLERAAAAPPVTPDEGLAVLYELADALQRMGEPARALAVFMELQSQRRAYRDVAARIASLSAQDTGDPDA